MGIRFDDSTPLLGCPQSQLSECLSVLQLFKLGTSIHAIGDSAKNNPRIKTIPLSDS